MRSWITLPLLLPLAAAQTFEVASVKPSGPQSGNDLTGGPGTSDPIRWHYTSATLEDLIVTAYNIEYFQVIRNAPVDRDHFDLVAKIRPGATKQEFRVMLQNLLTERFRLKLHWAKWDFSGYALVVAPSGLKIADGTTRPTAPQQSRLEGFPEIAPEKTGIKIHETVQDGHVLVRLSAQIVAMSDVARSLHVPGDAPVVDETGLRGKYSFTLEYTYPMHDSPDVTHIPPAPSVLTALQTKLGLRLVSKRVPLDVLVVDSFDRLPTEN